MKEIVIGSPLGNLLLTEKSGSLVQVGFTNQPVKENTDSRLLPEAAIQLKNYFSGQLKDFDLPLSPGGTAFQQRVWRELRLIPYGETISYKELAQRLGDVKSIRAAGTANGQNPIAIIIPCHRVIGSDGGMVGYAGGIDKKKTLLKLEGAAVMNQLNIF